MDEVEILCRLAGKLARRHGYGKPLHRDRLVRFAAIPRHREGQARDAFAAFRRLSFIKDLGGDLVRVDHSAFASMIVFLHRRCGWPEEDLRVRFHHFEGWEDLELSPDPDA